MGPEIPEERLAAARARLDEIRANLRKVRKCQRHRFEEQPKAQLGHRIACSSCGGTMDNIAAFHYIRGFIAAGGDPLVVAPWWVQAHETRGLAPADGAQS